MVKRRLEKLERLSGNKITLECKVQGQEWVKTGTVFCVDDGSVEFIYVVGENINGIFKKGEIPKLHKSGQSYLIPRCGPSYGVKYYNPDLGFEEYDLRKRALENALE